MMSSPKKSRNWISQPTLLQVFEALAILPQEWNKFLGDNRAEHAEMREVSLDTMDTLDPPLQQQLWETMIPMCKLFVTFRAPLRMCQNILLTHTVRTNSLQEGLILVLMALVVTNSQVEKEEDVIDDVKPGS